MPLDIRHQKVVSLPDGPDPAMAQPSDWNDSIDYTGNLESTRVELDGAISPYSDGATLHSVLTGIIASLAGAITSAFTQVRKNSTGTNFSRGRLNFIEGTNITITVADDSPNNEVDITFAASVGGGSGIIDHTTYVSLDTGRRSLTNEFNDGGLSFGSVATRDTSVYSARDVYLEPASGKVVWIDTGDGLLMATKSSDPTGRNDAHLYWNTATKQLRVFRKNSNPSTGQWHDVGSQGWASVAYPIGYVDNGTYTTAVTLPANGGTIAVPISVPSPMLVHSLEFYNTDSTLTREWEISLFFDKGTSATADRHYDSNEFGGGGTVSSADIRTLTFSIPPRVPAGICWALIRNIDASNTLGIGTLTTAGTFAAHNHHQTKTLTSYLGDALTLDLVTSWSKATGIPGVALRGRVLGQSSAF